MAYQDTLIQHLINKVARQLEQQPQEGATAEEQRAYNARLRSMRMSLARARGSHTAAEWEAILVETGGICVRCGRPAHPVCKGHVIPISDNGTDAIDNLQPLCKTCSVAGANERLNWLEYWRANRPTPLDTETTDA